MTKIRNTKKGMAKKTLSISLAVAMLATSNVPVWAAEDLFTDGAAAVETVEAPVEDVFSDAAEAPAEEVPVVEEVTEAPEAHGDSSADINLERYVVKDLAIENVGEWETDTAKVTGSITKNGVPVEGFNYTWQADGNQAGGEGAAGVANSLDEITYTPVKDDFNKEISLCIYKKGDNNSLIFSQTITFTKNKVQPKNISTLFTTAPVTKTTTNYNGKEQKLPVTNVNAFTKRVDDVTIKYDDFSWSYAQKNNDFINATGTDVITVKGSLSGTYVKTSNAYGYTATTGESAAYTIAPLPVTTNNLKLNLNKTEVQYTGDVHTFKKADISLGVKVDEETTVDITDALKNDFNVVGTANKVGKGYKVTKTFNTNSFDTTDAAKKIMNNFTFTQDVSVGSQNTYEITVLDLNTCTGVVKELTLATFKARLANTNNTDKISPSEITLTCDGKEFTLDKLASDVSIIIEQNAIDAADNNQTGTIDGAVTVTYKANTHNVTGSISLPLTLTTKSLAGKQITANFGGEVIRLDSSSASASGTKLKVPYIAEAYDLQAGKNGISAFKIYEINPSSANKGTVMDPTEYEISYENNVDAGIVKATIRGLKSYEGSVKTIYFEITPSVKTLNATMKSSVTVNTNNNADASLYADVLGLTVDTTLVSANGKVTLTPDKDYSVKYYYGKKGLKTEAEIKVSKANNVAGDYVYAVVTINKGNYATPNTLIKSAEIMNKSISNVTVTVEKDAYTYTGKEIVPNVTVTDGTTKLYKGEDYTVRVKDNVNVGTATITIVPTKTSGYDTNSFATATFEITPADAETVAVTLGATPSAILVKENVFEYTGRQIKPEATRVMLGDKDVTEQFDVAYPSYGENINAGEKMGSVTIAPKTTNKNFTGTKTQLFDIQGEELKGALRAYYGDKTQVTVNNKTAYNKSGLPYSFYYDGAAQTFADATFTPSALIDAIEGTDYEIKYINNTDAGTAFVAVVAKGNYVGTTCNTTFGVNNSDAYYQVKGGKLYAGENTVLQSNVVDIIAFNIQPSYFTARNISYSNGAYAAGKPVKPVVSVVVNGRTLVEGTDYKLKLTAIEGEATPDKFVDVTEGKPYYVTVVPMGGYRFDDVNGTNTFVWGIDKKDLADCVVTVTKNGEDFDLKVMNGNVVEIKEDFDVTDNGDGTATVSVIDGGKNYTGSATVAIIDPDDKGAVGIVEIADVKVDGNKATVILTGEAENAEGYDYVISTVDDWKNGRVDITKNQLKTTGDFFYVQKGTYYAYCHAYRRDENGMKVFSPEFSKTFKFTVTAITPEKPVITKVTRKGNDVTVTYTAAKDAEGYDVVLGTANRVVNGERRPVDYGTLVKKNLKEGTTSVTFKNVPEGTYYAGLHAFNRSRQDNNNKVFSPWSNIKTVVVE